MPPKWGKVKKAPRPQKQKVTVTLSVRLLATFEISTDSKLVVDLSPRLQTLVAYVALYRHTVCSRRQVATALWPETTDDQALKNLRTQITRLRQVLPAADQMIEITRHALQWRSGGAVLDVALFQSAVHHAVTLRPSDPAAALELCDAAIQYYTADLLPTAYDEWLIPLREQLRREYLMVLELLSTLLEQQGRQTDAIAAAEHWVRADPGNELTYAHLMRLYLAQGDRNAALRTYQAAETALREDLDSVPGPRLQVLFLQAQAHSEPAGGPAPGLHRAAEQAAPGTAAPEPTFVGRERELQWLQAVWQRCMDGAGQFALVTGEAGIGKTRLVEEWLAGLARQGIAVATTHCFGGGEALAYAPLAELFRNAFFLPRLQGLEAAWAGEVARLLPELLAADQHVAPPGPLTESWQRQRFLQALTRLALGPQALAPETVTEERRRQHEPLALFFDDLQWCDGETLGWLAYLMHASANSPLLVLATLRTEDLRPQSALEGFLLTLQRSGRYAEQELGPLSPGDTAVLAAHVGGRSLSQGEAHQLYQNTEGNPLFVVEIVRAWPSGTPLRHGPLPPKMHAVVRYRFSQLSPAARAATETAAVAGRYFNLDLVVRAGGQSEAEAVTGIDELWRRHIIRVYGQVYYEFTHDQLRQVAYASISPERRRWLHERIAEVLAHAHAADPESMAGQIAHHYTLSAHPEKALDYCLLAAGAASRIFANSEAIAFFQQAQSLLSENDTRMIGVLEWLGELHRRQGNWQESQRAYVAALELLDEGTLLRRATFLDKLGRTLIASNQRVQAWEALSAARALLESTTSARDEAWYTVWISVLLALMEWHYWGGSTDAMAQLSELLQSAVRRYGSHAQQIEWQQLVTRMEFRRSRYVFGDALVEERHAALELVRRHGDPFALAVAQFGYGFTLLWNGRLEQGGAQLRAALHQARHIGLVLVETQCLVYLAIIARLRGQPEEARSYTMLTLESARASQRLDYVGIAHANLAWLAWRSGDLSTAKQEAVAALADWQEAATGNPFCWLALWPLIGVALKENRLEQALNYAALLLEDTQQPPPQTIRERLAGAFAAWQAGNGLQARAHLDAAASVAVSRGHL